MTSTNAHTQASPVVQKQIESLLSGAKNSWSIGFALLDRTLCYGLVNQTLALMNRVSVRQHFGARLKTIVGDCAQKVEPLMEQVFSTGKPVLHYEFSGTLPNRREETCWTVSYFPVFAAPSNVSQVAAVVLDTTIIRRLERQFADLFDSPQGSGWQPQLNSHDIGERIVDSSRQPQPSLTLREMQTLKLLANGNSNKQVASNLGLSVRTVETYRAKMMLKLGVRSVSELVRVAIRSNLIEV